MKKITLISLLFFLYASISFGKEIDVEVIKKGMLGKNILIETKVVNDQEKYTEIWDLIGEKSKLPAVDFEKESVVFIVSQNKKAEKISVKRVERRPGNQHRFIISHNFNSEYI